MIDILLPTFNGAAFLEEQLDSIFRQSNADFRLLVRDDGSTDGTRAVLARWAAARQNVVCIDPEGAHLGPAASVSRLLERSQAPYVMLCDQDNVWRPEKIAVLLARMHRLEEELGSQTPILVHSDLVVVDSSLRTLHPSFWACRRLDPVRGVTLRRLTVENVVAGCSAMINRALADQCLPIPQQAIMHDWWMALVAAARGRIECVAEPLTLYRQHAASAVGVRRPGLAAILNKTAEDRKRRRGENHAVGRRSSPAATFGILWTYLGRARFLLHRSRFSRPPSADAVPGPGPFGSLWRQPVGGGSSGPVRVCELGRLRLAAAAPAAPALRFSHFQLHGQRETLRGSVGRRMRHAGHARGPRGEPPCTKRSRPAATASIFTTATAPGPSCSPPSRLPRHWSTRRKEE